MTLEENTFAYCQTGVHVINSQFIHIGPELIEDFAAKKNQLHHIQVTEEIKGKRLLAILHANFVDSSPYTYGLGIINGPTGIAIKLISQTYFRRRRFC